MNNLFTSDWHLGHLSMQKGIRGKVFKTLEDHDNTILQNIFDTVKPGDNLYFLGDAFWKKSSKEVEKIMTDFKKHKINIFWAIGNHDKYSWTKYNCVQWAGEIKDIVIEKQPITLCHYPMYVWKNSHYGAWNLHGHIHKEDNTYKLVKNYELMKGAFFRGQILNLNVEFWDYKPLTFEHIRETMKYRPENWDLIRKEN